MQKKKIILCLLLIAGIGITSNIVNARAFYNTLYVTAAGSDTYSGLTRAGAFKTLTHSIAVAKSDDPNINPYRVRRITIIGTLDEKSEGQNRDRLSVFYIRDSGEAQITITSQKHRWFLLQGSRSAMMAASGLAGSASRRVIKVEGVSNILFEDLTIGEGRGDQSGGGIYVGKSAVVTIGYGAKVVSSQANDGGGICVDGGTLVMTGGEIADNHASNKSGGVFIHEGTFTMTGGVIHHNRGTDGGGVSVSSGTFMMTGGGVITGNTAQTGGGVFINSGGSFVMTGGAAIRDNRAIGGGGIAFIGPLKESSKFELSGGATIERNQAQIAGGVFIYDGMLTLLGGTEIKQNRAAPDTFAATDTGSPVGFFARYATAFPGNAAGGGIFLDNKAQLKMEGGVITANEAQSGGGIFVHNGSSLQLMAGDVRSNKAVSAVNAPVVGDFSGEVAMSGRTYNYKDGEASGGGVFINSGSTFNMFGGTVRGNNAETGIGGGIYVNNNTVANIRGGEISGNSASSGAGMFIGGTPRSMCRVVMSSGSIFGNRAASYGGGLYVTGTEFNLTGGEVRNNTVSRGIGGGFYINNASEVAMSGGKINNNDSLVGGGVLLYAATLAISGGEIVSNKAHVVGGVFVAPGSNLKDSGKTMLRRNIHDNIPTDR
ncbi:MAG: hypothetical protein Ta2A_00320 [Treponemataceae bacterium]|nr:MAG: hypothetical protein Ta2A_00320 [Treponemataceae bacterium]